jgi:hypothetical protein
MSWFRGVTIIGTKTYAKDSSHPPKCNGLSSPMAIGPPERSDQTRQRSGAGQQYLVLHQPVGR